MTVSDTIRTFSRILTRQQMQYADTEFKRVVTHDYDGLNLTVKITSVPFPGEEGLWQGFDHITPDYCLGEHCICGRLATHKVGEETEQPRHPTMSPRRDKARTGSGGATRTCATWPTACSSSGATRTPGSRRAR
jgi:hypothetical protein